MRPETSNYFIYRISDGDARLIDSRVHSGHVLSIAAYIEENLADDDAKAGDLYVVTDAHTGKVRLSLTLVTL